MRRRTPIVGLVSAAVLLLAAGAWAQRGGRGGGGFGGGCIGSAEGELPTFPPLGEFHFIRMEYTDLPNHHRGFGFSSRTAQGNGWWVVDWPDADFHFSE